MNTKMKALSLALVGLAGFGFAGAAAAGTGCPSSPVPPWSSAPSLGGSLVISPTGLDGSACKLDASITLNGPGVSAAVRDDTPASEPTYRAQFLVNLDALGAVNSIQGFKLFSATTTTPSQSVPDVVRLTVFGNLSGTTTNLGIVTACADQPSGICVSSTPLASGVNTVEIQWIRGTGGTTPDGALKVWVNNNVEASPTISIDANNGAWGGVDFSSMGIANPSPGFRSAHLNQVVSVDTFDSRRTTFIGF